MLRYGRWPYPSLNPIAEEKAPFNLKILVEIEFEYEMECKYPFLLIVEQKCTYH